MPQSHQQLIDRHDVLGDRVLAAFRRFVVLYLKANFDPNQPRVPRGHHDGGQWTDDPAWGGGETYRRRRRRNQSNDFAEPVSYPRTIADLPSEGQVRPSQSTRRRTRVAQTEMGSAYAIGDLHQHEGRGGAHTIALHVAKSDRFLRDRLIMPKSIIGTRRQYYTELSTFRNIKEATSLINRTLSDPANRVAVEAVISGRKRVAVLTKTFSRDTGHGIVTGASPGQSYSEYSRPRRWKRMTMRAVKVVIFTDPGLPTGFRVQTAYPIRSAEQ